METIFLDGASAKPGTYLPWDLMPRPDTPRSGCTGRWRLTDGSSTWLRKYGVPDLSAGWPAEPVVVASDGFATLRAAADNVLSMITTGVVGAGRLRVLREGMPVDASEYELAGRGFDLFQEDRVDPARVREILDDRGTLAVFAVQDIERTAAVLCTRAAAMSGARAGSTLFYSAAGASGFSAHYDEFHSLLIQLDGSKEWNVQASPVSRPGPGHSWPVLRGHFPGPGELETQGSGSRQITLQPGSALWIPAGWAHSGIAGDLPSTHFTLVFSAWHTFEIMRMLMVDAGSVPQLRTELTATDIFDGDLPALCAGGFEDFAAALGDRTDLHQLIIERMLSDAPYAPYPEIGFGNISAENPEMALAIRSCDKCVDLHFGDRILHFQSSGDIPVTPAAAGNE